VNGGAGTDASDVVATLRELFSAAPGDVVIAGVEGSAIEEQVRRALREGCRTIVAGGGDGTIGAVANLLVGQDATLGVLPLGTLNHFAKDLQIPLTLDGAVRTILDGVVRRVDVGEVNGRFFLNNSSIGAYPRIVTGRERRRRRGEPKWVAHVLAAVGVWNRYRHLRVTLHADGTARVVRTPFLFVGNNEYQLTGLELGARRSLDAGVLHVCLAPGMTRAGVAQMIGAALMRRLGAVQGLETQLTTELSIDAAHGRLLVSLDGEVAAMPVPLVFRIVPAALRVLVPAEAPDAAASKG
jgi:diacylglycerol kinase family enzyme